MKIRKVQEWDAPNLPEWVKASVSTSGLSVQSFCESAEISRQFYYDVINDRAESISRETLDRIEGVLGKKYMAGDSDED